MEQQVGIEEYITETTGFTGILKHRYNDFQVFEVDLSGRTARLTTTDAPQVPADSAAVLLTDAAIAEVVAAFAATAGQANAEELKKLLSNIRQQQQRSEQQQQPEQLSEPMEPLQLEVDLQPEPSKDVRKAIHLFLKSDPRLPPLATDSVAAEGAVAGPDGQVPHHVIRIRSAAGQNRGQGRQKGGQDKRGNKRGNREWRNDPSWEGGDQKFTKFVMLKENTDTQAALTVIARMLHSQIRSFGFAGTKDKRGVTTQWVTVWKTPPAKLAALNAKLRGIKIGNFEFASSQLSLGQLKGNMFRVLMRDINTHDEQHVSSAVSELRDKGFINYFGLQRFGTGSVPTHRVGGALLRGEWRAAVQLIMQAGPDERDELKQARALYTEKGDIQGALRALPTFLVAERAVLQALAKNGPSAYLSALQAIPRTLRSMYLHAWQSWLWNRAASERVRRYGPDKVVPGDLVLLSTDQQQQQRDESLAADSEGKGTAGAANGGNSVAPAADEGGYDLLDELYAQAEAGQLKAAAPKQAQVAAKVAAVPATAGARTQQAATDDDDPTAASAASRLSSVHIVTEADVAANRFNIQDVVLPMPGSRVRYPQNAAGWEFYCQMAAADGVMLPGMTAAEYKNAAALAAAGAASSEAGSSSSVSVPVGHSVADFSLDELTGDYRKLLHVPADMTHRIIRYTDPNADLMPSDWSELEHKQQADRPAKRQRLGDDQQQRELLEQQEQAERQLADAEQDSASQQGQAVQQEQTAPGEKQQQNGGVENAGVADKAAVAVGDDGSKEMVAVVLEFTLPSSSYATMLVRELTKSCTSKASHKEMSTAKN